MPLPLFDKSQLFALLQYTSETSKYEVRGAGPARSCHSATRPRAVRALAAMAPKTGSSNGPVPKGSVTIPLDDISTGPGSSWRVRDDERAMGLARTFMKGDYLKTILIKPTLLSESGVPKVIG